MAATIVTSPYSSILDLTGVGLSLGSVYIGGPNQDPQTNPQAVYWDAALTVAATQPLQVSAGYIMRSGSPSAVFTSGDYSIRALDHNGVQVFYRATSLSVTQTIPATRTLLSANLDLFVSAGGSDTTGTGTAGAPWATIQKAFNVLQSSYDLAGFTATIHLGAGTFASAVMTAPIPGASFGAGSVTVSGAGAGVTTIQGAAGLPALGASGGGKFTVQNVTLGGTGAYGLQANSGGNIGFLSVTFAAVSFAQVFADYQGTITIAGSYTVSGGALAHFYSFGGGAIVRFGGPYVCTVTGTPAFGGAFAFANDNGLVNIQNSWLTFSGAATGPRYYAAASSTIDTLSSGASYFPGSSAGSTALNGNYI